MAARRILWLSGLTAAIVWSACGGSTGPKRTTPTAAPEPAATIELRKGEPIKIGVSAALSGDQKTLGIDLADTVELAAKEQGAKLRGHAVAILRMDDGCGDAEQAVSVAHALAGDPSMAGVIGPMCTTGAQAADSVYEAAHVVHILPSATRADLSQLGEQFFFRTTWLDEAQARTQAEYALGTLRAATATVIDDAEPYGKTLADAFATAFEAGGGSIASRERIRRGDTDFTALSRKVQSATPDVVVFEGLNPEGALVVQALRKDNYSGYFVAPDGVLNARDFIEPGKDAKTGATPADGAILTGGPTPDEQFVAKFRDAFHRPPGTPFVLQAHDATTALLTAIAAVATERADGSLVIDRVRLAETLRARGLDGLTGTIRFDQHGDRSGSSAKEAGLTVYRVVDGRFVAQ